MTENGVFAGRSLHPRHGVHAPRAALIPRRPGSVRRTSTIDTVRPGDILGDAVQIGRARDLRTNADGTSNVLATASVSDRLDYANHYQLLELRSEPALAALGQLVGSPVSTGFRARVEDLVPDERLSGTLLHLLLDDLPGAALVSGYAVGASGRIADLDRKGPNLQVEGLCAGFQKDGTIMVELSAGRHSPVVTGPLLPPEDIDDPHGWHDLREMGPHDMRRWRRLDVVPGISARDPVSVEAYFRDSHVDPQGVDTVVHEYTVRAIVDPVEQIVISSEAIAHSLPWAECIQAESSGDRLAGRPLWGLRPSVRAELVGTTTCTHLNDTLRSLEDVRALLRVL